MTEFHLTLPSRVEPRPELPGFVTDLRGRYDAVGQVTRGADLAGLSGVVAPFDPDGRESLVVAAGALRASRHLRVTAEFPLGIATPVYAAKLSASLQRFSGARLAWRPAVDLDRAVARAQGDFLEGADRHARAEEFLTVAKGVWHEPDFSFEGRFYEVLNGGLGFPLAAGPFPRVELSGPLELSIRHADVHVFGVGEVIDTSAPGPAYGLRLPLLARETDDEALTEAGRTGFTGLTGSYETVAAAIGRYAEQGIEVFHLEARPQLAEAYRLGEHLLPLLRKELDDVR